MSTTREGSTAGARSQDTRCHRRLSSQDRARTAAMGLVILVVNVLGWLIFSLALLPRHFRDQGLGIGVGVAITAWTLGMRHAFDADHISAIDNVTRKLMSDGKRPLSTGFFFAVGHSTIVFALAIGIAAAARTFFSSVVNSHSMFASTGGVTATLLSGSFLYLIAAINTVVLAGIVRVFREMHKGAYDEQELEAQLEARGLMYRFFGRFMRSITKSRQMFFVGLAFGVGFDTTTEVLLLTATATAATEGLPWYAVMALPLLFSGGMLLLDSADGFFMSFAYGWAFARPVRKVYYNLVVTAMSVGVAFVVGTIELMGLLATQLHLHGSFWDAMANFDLNRAGFMIAVMFVLVWAVALAVWRFGRVERRWEERVP